jgi:MFS family permease
MTAAWRSFARFSPTVRLLLVSFGLFNFAFYMLLPFLTTHLHGTVGLAAWSVGLLMGLRNFSQQGLYLIGGSLADRLGHRRVLLTGCLMRAAGFALLGCAESTWLLAVAVVLSGFAAALYAPAAQALLADLCEHDRTGAFALASVFRAAGELLGPLAGVLLLGLGFHAVGLCSALIFAALFALVRRSLPAADPVKPAQTVLGSWRALAAQPHFLGFALAMSGYFVLVAQLSLLLPLELKRATGSDASVAWLFTLSAIVGIGLQMPATRFLNARMPRERGMALGHAVMAVAFLPLLLDMSAAPAWAAVPALACGVLLTLGSLAIHPPMMASVADFAPAELRATAYGLFYLVSALVVLAANVLVGDAFVELGAQGSLHLLWLGLAAWAVLAAMLLAGGALSRRAPPGDPAPQLK